jgi:heparosan-N-sulfate-glucuronate 5-epimerase
MSFQIADGRRLIHRAPTKDASREGEPDLFRRAGSLQLPVGPRLASEAVRGYPIDLRAKAADPLRSSAGMELGGLTRKQAGGEAGRRMLYVALAQWGLGCFERYLNGDGEEWLGAALGAGHDLVVHQDRGGRFDGGWVHRFALPHTYPLAAPWVSAMAQGEAASLLVRLYQTTGDEEFAEAALKALRPLRASVSDGGTRVLLGGGPFLEEYPTHPHSLVLNGAFFALWGLHDVGLALGEDRAVSEFGAGVSVLADELHRWDTGYWSRYDLFPHRVANLANPFYHRLHVDLLRAMCVLAPRRQFYSTIELFEAYERSFWSVGRAYSQKVLFRMISPRSPVIQRILPWRPSLAR